MQLQPAIRGIQGLDQLGLGQFHQFRLVQRFAAGIHMHGHGKADGLIVRNTVPGYFRDLGPDQGLSAHRDCYPFRHGHRIFAGHSQTIIGPGGKGGRG